MLHQNHAPAPLDSGFVRDPDKPPQVMSPSMEDSSTKANVQAASGSISQIVTQPIQATSEVSGQLAAQIPQSSSGSTSLSASQVKNEPLSQVKGDPTMKTKPESSSSAQEVKVEQEESESKEENRASVKQEEQPPEPDSEDSFTPERVIEAVQRLLDTRDSRASACVQHTERERERERERQVCHRQVRAKERLSQRHQENKDMDPMYFKGEDEQEEDIARPIRSYLALLSFWSTLQMLMKRRMTRWDIYEADSCVWNITLRH